jgi:hypothetical protein
MSRNLQTSWRSELVALIDEAVYVTKVLRDSPVPTELNRPMLIRTIAVLDELRRKTINFHLPPPNGRTTLGVARGVLDFVDDLNGALAIAAGAIERHYLTIARDNPQDSGLEAMSIVHILPSGQTMPELPEGQALLRVENRAIVAIGVWRCDENGSHLEQPLNASDLFVIAAIYLVTDSLNEKTTPYYLICPSEITEKMVWPEDQVLNK